jgi:hypothetical protein
MNAVRMFSDQGIIDRAVTRYTIGFVDHSQDPPGSLGSGTFVRFETVSGILTCAHVIEALIKAARHDGTVGIVAFAARADAIQHIRIRIDATTTISFRNDAWTKDGPDIGFVKLSPNEAEWVSVRASCLNGDEQASVAISNKEPKRHAFSVDYTAGVIAEWTKTEPLGRNRRITLHAFSNGGQISSIERHGGFDYMTFSPESEPGLVAPKSYEGTSGGGVWRLFLGDNQDSVILREHRLIGVAFYQLDGLIVAHGPSTIYRRLRPEVLSKFGE